VKLVYNGSIDIHGGPKCNFRLLEVGEAYEASRTVYMSGFERYIVKIDDVEHFFPVEWFVNITELQLKHKSTVGVCLCYPTKGKRASVIVSVTDTSVKYLNTTLVESFEEIAPDWFLFTTKSGSHYIVQVDPDYLLYKLSDDPNANF